jgi:hypothetical protein
MEAVFASELGCRNGSDAAAGDTLAQLQNRLDEL